MRRLPRLNPILLSGAVFPPGAAAARAGSKSSLKVGRLGRASVDVSAPGAIVVAEGLVCARQRPPQFPLRPYSCPEECHPIPRITSLSDGGRPQG
jgi:hypothetical protein